MNSEELRKLQAPLKEQYKSNPESAVVTLTAEGNIGEGISCKVETGQRLAQAGLHPATGGDGTLACSGDLLLEALVACAGVTLKSVSTAIGIKVKSGIVKAEGDLDFRGTLAVSKEAPVGFRNIRLTFQLDCDTDAEKKATLLKLTERYCVVLQTISTATPVSSSISCC
ncbi:OsmC family protein [Maribellus sediminis]|uniref:OsmC family protein n=1 Tax=Maribellus sediminis TaxID=2696285 RepID=UPI001432012C|nr:OsmC family protein [Maribellus sediminis]